MKEDSTTGTPLAGLHFAVCELKRRNVRSHPIAHCQWGVRLGPNADGAPPHPPVDASCGQKYLPPELLTFLQNPDQVGYPETLNTDARLGFSVMAYQAWGILYGSCGAASVNPVRPSIPVAKGHVAPERTPTQRGKVGLCPCCAVATHVAVPGSYRLEPSDLHKHTGLRP